VQLNTRVTEAKYHEEENRWHLKTAEGALWKCRWFIAATGTSFKQYEPEWAGREQFEGVIHHSSLWPDHVEIKDKKVAVIGAGSTGVQIVQEASKVSKQVTQFMRTPNFAVPMRQRQISEEEIYAYLPQFPHVFKAIRSTRTGLPVEGTGLKVFDESPEQRDARLEHLWKRGGFNW
jgi:cation diffusion facilitator CzcD-associated flavoprotein CzcO